MRRMDRRTFMFMTSAGATGAVLTACGNDPDDVELNPTLIPVEGAPPTLAPFATPGGGAVEATPAEDEGGSGANVVELEAEDPYAWSVNELEAAPGQVILVTNVGALEHDFVIDELEINEELPPGEAVEVTLPDDIEVGESYIYYCSVPGHRESGMEGTLTIVEAATPAGEDEASPAAAESTPGEDEADSSTAVELEAEDPYAWSATELEAAPGQVIMVTNVGALEHDFVIDELEINVDLPPGEPVEVTLPDSVEVGESYIYFCSVPGHRESGMEGTLTIVEASPVEGEEGAPAESDESGASEEIAVSMVELAFEPAELTIPSGADVTVAITNDGVLPHDFVIDELEIHTDLLDGGGSTTVTINAEPGTYTYYCSVAGHRESGMEGTLTIE